MVHILLAIIYLGFIGLGLPDSLLGAAWPSMYGSMNVPISYAGIISMIIAAGTVVSSLQSDRLTKNFGTGLVTGVSVAMTAAALFGFSLSSSFWMLCIWAIPYGLGAGSVDAALNNYVALNYASRHMSWLHCMWGVGTIIGPNILGYLLMAGQSWNKGYFFVALMQLVLTLILFLSLPLWKKGQTKNASASDFISSNDKEDYQVLSLKQIVSIKGAKEIMIAFFCYSSVEQTATLWSGSYLALHNNISADEAAGYASLVFIGITLGRVISGFLTFKFDDTQMIRIGQVIICLGIVTMLLPLGNIFTIAGLFLIGLGCAPIYPSIIHSTPKHFGADKSQAVIGVQMASAYIGTCFMPPLFGLIANHISVSLMPLYLFILLAMLFLFHENLIKKTAD